MRTIDIEFKSMFEQMDYKFNERRNEIYYMTKEDIYGIVWLYPENAGFDRFTLIYKNTADYFRNGTVPQPIYAYKLKDEYKNKFSSLDEFITFVRYFDHQLEQWNNIKYTEPHELKIYEIPLNDKNEFDFVKMNKVNCCECLPKSFVEALIRYTIKRMELN